MLGAVGDMGDIGSPGRFRDTSPTGGRADAAQFAPAAWNSSHAIVQWPNASGRRFQGVGDGPRSTPACFACVGEQLPRGVVPTERRFDE